MKTKVKRFETRLEVMSEQELAGLDTSVAPTSPSEVLRRSLEMTGVTE